MVGLASLAAFTRLLAPAQFGNYVALLALVGLLQSAGFLWLQNGVLRSYSKCRDDHARADLASAAKVGFVLAGIGISAAWLTLALLDNQFLPRALWVVGLPALLISGWIAIARSWLRVHNQTWRFVAVDIVQSLGGFGLSILALLTLGAEPALVVTAGAIGGLIAISLSSDLVRRPFTSVFGAGSLLGALWRYGAPLTMVGFLTSVMAVSDRLLVAALVGAPSAGAYGVGYAIADRAIMLALVPVTFAMKPTIFAAFESGTPLQIQGLLNQSARWLMSIGLPITTLLVCSPAPLVALFAGGGLAAEAEAVVPWVAIGSLLGALLSLHFGLAFQLASRTGGMIAVLAPAAILNVVANLLLLPVFGMIAAAWTTVAAYAFALCLSAYFGRRHHRIPFPVKDAMISAAACIPLAALLRFAAETSLFGYLLAAGAGAIAYLIALTLLYRLLGSACEQDEVADPPPQRLR
ncbi:lipopolysaccharide biosynthesis protein [Sphingomonas sp. 7/4-4]|uniref:lipopolysaccharide biosynthesis protein n=1 Tax=Sphingomonas sp. 7/4-4 TaxID=3018446 RepID=UPI0022F3B170|nr:lipopolysaccharide biosynthesis protein [Sphingomonas sp. 7/4-4]WBY09974.1 lipopolysaccharide biosynthesis protein [Sphingomonas sp. 7/4-4]